MSLPCASRRSALRGQRRNSRQRPNRHPHAVTATNDRPRGCPPIWQLSAPVPVLTLRAQIWMFGTSAAASHARACTAQGMLPVMVGHVIEDVIRKGARRAEGGGTQVGGMGRLHLGHSHHPLRLQLLAGPLRYTRSAGDPREHALPSEPAPDPTQRRAFRHSGPSQRSPRELLGFPAWILDCADRMIGRRPHIMPSAGRRLGELLADLLCGGHPRKPRARRHCPQSGRPYHDRRLRDRLPRRRRHLWTPGIEKEACRLLLASAAPIRTTRSGVRRPDGGLVTGQKRGPPHASGRPRCRVHTSGV